MRKAIGKLFLKWGEKMAMGYDAGDSNRMRKDLGWGRSTPRDEEGMVGSDRTRETMRQKGSDLRRNNPTVAGVCERLALFSVGATGIIPQARTKDGGWNKAAEQWFAEWSMKCDSRGRATLYDFQNMAVSLRPTHGGMYFQKLDDGTIRPIECERIRQPQDVEKAKLFVDGVKTNQTTGQIKTFSVHSRDKDGSFSAKHDEADVDAENILRVIKAPWRPDQVREIPDLAPIIPALQDIHEMNSYTLNSAKWQSQILAFLKKQGGGGLNSLGRSSTPAPGARQTFKQQWGEILEGLPGDELEFKQSIIPNATHIPYVKLQLALCASALSMPYEFFTLDLSGLDFSRQKGMLLLVNYACRPWKRWLADTFLTPLWNWRIAMAMTKDLKPAPTQKGISEWRNVEWQYPEEIWIDRQEQNQADILEWQMGQGTMSQFAGRRGQDLETLLRRKAQDMALAKQIETEFGIDPNTLINTQIPGQTPPGQTATEDKKPAATEREEDAKKSD
jgi:lambda family phage portal protein